MPRVLFIYGVKHLKIMQLMSFVKNYWLIMELWLHLEMLLVNLAIDYFRIALTKDAFIIEEALNSLNKCGD